MRAKTMGSKGGRTFPHQSGKCQVCADEGISPSEAIACALHSTHQTQELQAELAIAKRAMGGSSRLHLAIAKLSGSVPSIDGKEELGFVKELLKRADTVRDAIQKALDVANYE